MTTTLNASTAGAGGFIATGDNSGSLALQTAGTTAVTIDSSQNSTFAGKVTSAGALTLASNGTTTAVTVDTSQNVSIGSATNTTYGKLSVFNAQSDGNQTIANSGLLFANSVGGQFAQAAIWPYGSSGFAGALLFGTSPSGSGTFTPTERMRIDSSGNLLVGGTSRNGVGRVEIKCTNGVDNGLVCYTTASGGATGTLVYFLYNNTTFVGSITSAGSSTSYGSISDYRLKENVQPMTGALAKVAQLKPCTYKWKSDGSDGQGFIAHELQAVVPDAVVGEKDAVDVDENPIYQNVDTSFLIATLTAAIQELKAINDTQAETINALTARIVAIESRGTV